MKILQVNKFHYPRGGADKYFLDLAAALRSAGHEVAVFAMQHPQNLPAPESRYFVSRISFNSRRLKDQLKAPGRVLYSLEAKRKFSALVKDFQPEIIHLHNIYHHLSPSILSVAKEHKIPVVMHLHDYKLICANHALFAHGAYCEHCRPNRYYQCFLRRCLKDSYAASALAAAEMYLHHSILKIYEKNIAVFIAPSRFMKEIVVSFGQPAEKIQVIYNGYNPELLKPGGTAIIDGKLKDGGYLLYFGRLSEEKGLDTLIRAAALSGQSVKIAGRGPVGEKLKQLAGALKAPVEFLGQKTGAELSALIAGAKAAIIPSIWPENMPLSLLEALSLGKPVIASNIGGLPEVIADGRNGFLFAPGKADDLARCIEKLAETDLSAMGQAAKITAAAFSPQQNLAAVLAVYRSLLKGPANQR
ncbi:MAG: glycosyltransferase family 4 protein [Patescibacteria group bacterium]